MKTEKKRFGIPGKGLIAVCILAIIVSASSIITTYRMQKMASIIYEHPYTVSNESRATRSRLLDMRFFIMSMFTRPDWSEQDLQQLLNERYEMQYHSIGIISRQYLGPKEDADRLQKAMEALEKTQNEALPIVVNLDEQETIKYVEANLYPKYDAVNDALETIIDYADKKVQNLEKDSRGMATKATAASVLLTLFLPSYFLLAFWREQKNIQEVRYREQLFDNLSTSVDMVFLILNQEHDSLEYVSSNCERVLEIKETEFTKDLTALRDRIAGEDQKAFDEFLQQRGLDGDKSIDLHMRVSSGEIRWIRLQMFPYIVHGKIVRCILSVSDQSEDMRIKQTLEDALINAQNANSAKQNFLSKMSHEIRTPMNAIIGMTTIAAAFIEDRTRVESCLEKIGYSSKHLMTLINDVLDMSKIDEGKMTVSKETFNLEHVAEYITSIIYQQAADKNIDFSMPLVDITDTDLLGDSLRLNQILINLLSNALKFTPEGGKVVLEIRQLQRKKNRVRLRFTVKDTGIGMTPEFMERLFQPFEQENRCNNQESKGTGLGMSITKNLITLMGGTIAVESEPNQGSTFTVELDFDTPVNEKQIHHRPQDLDALNVLIADDDRDSCLHTSLTLENLGISSSWVLSGTECVEKVISAHKIGEDYDVCFIDWKMPDMNGIEVTRKVREFVGPDTTIIIITAYDWSSIEKSAREAGANAFLSKPIFSSTLYNTLLSVTGTEKRVYSQGQEYENMQMADCRVLLVEDNELNREIAMEMLKLMNIDVTCACNGQEAVDIFMSDADELDLILMDVQMPVMNGYQSTESIRRSGHARAKTIPIIAMTANAFHEDVVKAYESGMNGHLAKPVDYQQLFQTIKSFLEEG